MPCKDKRAPSKCKEWEKQRRNKLNAVIESLNVLVTEEKKKLNGGDSVENERLSKFDIISKAIEFIKYLLKCNNEIGKKIPTPKVCGCLKGKSLSESKTILNEDSIEKKEKNKMHFKKAPKPTVKRKDNTPDKKIKKANKNLKTVLNVPAAILLKGGKTKPVRISALLMPSTVLLPTTPCMILPPNLTSLKNSVAILPRPTTKSITRTTMVNKVPIPSYSFSSNKQKKSITSNSKNKTGSDKKLENLNNNKPIVVIKEISSESKGDSYLNTNNATKTLDICNDKNTSHKDEKCKTDKEDGIKENGCKISEIKDNLMNSAQNESKPNLATSAPSTVCDGGNARLELAEELLASSPTAAFLMSFPLVSGMRAESPDLQNGTSQAQRNEHPHENREREVQNSFNSKTAETKMPESKKTEEFYDQKYCKTTKQQKDQTNLKVIVKPTMDSKASLLNINSYNSLFPATKTTANDQFTNFNLESNKIAHQNLGLIQNKTASSKESTSKVTDSVASSNTSWPHTYNDTNVNSFSFFPCSMERNPRVPSESFDDYMLKTTPFKLGYDLESIMPQKTLDTILSTTKHSSNSMINVNYPAVTTAPLTNNYNLFNTDFQLPLVSVSSTNYHKGSAISNNHFMYSQPSTLVSEEQLPTDSRNVRYPKHTSSLNQTSDNWYDSNKPKMNANNYQAKPVGQVKCRRPNFDVAHLVLDKNVSNKKSPKKNHVNWMTSESRPIQNFEYDFRMENKCSTKLNIPTSTEKQDFIDPSFLSNPITNITGAINQDDSFQQIWSNNRVSETNIESFSINIPTLNAADFSSSSSDTRKNVNSTNQFNCYQATNNIFTVPQLAAEKAGDTMPSWMIRSSSKNTKSSKETSVVCDKQDYSLNTPMYPYSYDTDTRNFFPNSDYSEMNNVHNVNQSHKHLKDRPSQNQKYNAYFTEALIRKEPNNKTPTSKKAIDTPKTVDEQNQLSRMPQFNPLPEYNESGYIQPFIYSSAASIPTNNFYPNYISSGSNLMPNYTPSNFSDLSDCISTLDMNNYATGADNYKNKAILEPLLFNKDYYEKNSMKLLVPDPSSSLKHKHDHKSESQKKINANKRQKINNDCNYTDPFFYKGGNAYPNKDTSKINQTQNYPFVSNDHISSHSSNTNRTNFHLSNLFPEIAKIKQ